MHLLAASRALLQENRRRIYWQKKQKRPQHLTWTVSQFVPDLYNLTCPSCTASPRSNARVDVHDDTEDWTEHRVRVASSWHAEQLCTRHITPPLHL